MKSLLIILASIAITNADVSHLFSSGPSNQYLPPQREPHHRYGPPPPQVQVNTNSDIPQSFYRIDPTIQTNVYRKPAQNYGPPPANNLGQSNNVEVHFIQLPASRQPIGTYAPTNQYLPPQQQQPIYRQPLGPIYRPTTPIYRQPVYQPQPIYRQPVYQPQPIYHQPAPTYQQPIYRPIAEPIPQPIPIPQPVQIPQPIQIPQPVPIPQPLSFPQPGPSYRQPSYHTTINYPPTNQYLPPPVQTNIQHPSESIAPQEPIPTFQPPSNEYLPPIEAKKVYVTGQITQPAIPISQPSNDYISPIQPQQIPQLPSYTEPEPEPAHSFGPTGYNYKRP